MMMCEYSTEMVSSGRILSISAVADELSSGEKKTYLENRLGNCWSWINLLKLVVVLSENPKISISDHFGRVEIESGIYDWCVSK